MSEDKDINKSQVDVQGDISTIIIEMVKEDFKESDYEEVIDLLKMYKGNEVERIQYAMLLLAKGDTEKLRYNVELANQDYRDILYYAFYRDRDSFGLLVDLIEDLESNIFTKKETELVKRAGLSIYIPEQRDVFQIICEIIRNSEKRITIEQFEMIQKIGKIIKCKSVIWKGLLKEV